MVYSLARVSNPGNPQLSNLYNASQHAGISSCSKVQLFGEYLHSFADTFGHRNSLNEPIDVNGGIGHALYNHEPDKTYDDAVFFDAFPMAIGLWNTREDRTLKMEQEMFKKIQSQFGTTAKDKNGHVITFASLETALKKFNAIRESEDNTSALFDNPGNRKRAALAKLMAELGLGTIPTYDVLKACQNRQQDIPDSGLAQADYPGTILATLDVCKTSR